ncbi:MAG: MBL fold metallo-hydrolase [Planctomycetota bacterium]|nr:MAG: MBL fold metallo-hydrolase [Planctomycetota bacterium]
MREHGEGGISYGVSFGGRETQDTIATGVFASRTAPDQRIARMLTCSLQSGSNGNAIYVEAGRTRLLFDAGISGRQVGLRLARHGRAIRDLDALILSHEHVDHVRVAGPIHRMHGVPVYATAATLRAARTNLKRITRPVTFVAGDALRIGEATIHTIPTPHDAADGVCFVVEHGRRRLGILTDLGHVFDELPGVLRGVHAAYVESNFDPQMLADGPYHPDVKARIAGPAGHLSNDEAAELIANNGAHLRWAALAHLSEENNAPEVALRAHRRRIGRDAPLWVAGRYQVSKMFEV